MDFRSFAALVLSLAPLMHGAVAAQRTAQLEHASPTTAPSCAAGLQVDNDGLIGGGPDYRARFAADGFRLVPALGPSAEHECGLEFALESLARGGERSFVSSAVAPRREGSAAIYARVGFEERYDVLPHGVEQSFVFDAPPRGSGDLVVRGHLRCELVPMASRGNPTETLAFEFAGRRVLEIGAVVGIDARGRRAAGWLRLDEGSLEIGLPGWFVDSASYPLTLDPLFTIAAGGNDYLPDVAYDIGGDRYLVVWVRGFSLFSSDVRAQRVSASGTLIGSMLTIATGGLSSNPRVSSAGGGASASRFLIAWQSGSSITGPFLIWARSVKASDGSLSSSALLSDLGFPADDVTPDVSGTHVVWLDRIGGSSTQGSVREATLSVPASGPPSITSVHSFASGTHKQRSPAIAGNVVVWQDEVAAGQQVRGAYLATPNVHVAISAAFSGSHVLQPDVATGAESSMIVWQQPEPTGAVDDIYCREADFGSAGVSFSCAPKRVSDVVGVHENGPAVAFAGATAPYNAGKFFIAYSKRDSGGDYDLVATTVVAETCDVCTCDTTVIATAGDNKSCALATQYHGLGSPDRALLVWETDDTPAPTEFDVVGQLLEGVGAGGVVVDLGGGCGAGTASTVGPVAAGNTGFAIHLDSAPWSATVGFLALRFAGGPVLACGSCVIGLAPFYKLAAAPIVAGPASLEAQVELPLPCDPGAVGFVFEAQWIVLPVDPSPCSMFAGLAFSNRLRGTIGD